MKNQENNFAVPEPPFVTYVRTMMFWMQRIKNSHKHSPVFISQKAIENRFFPYPQFDVKEEIGRLCNSGDIEMITNHKSDGKRFYTYRAIKSGNICPDLLMPKGQALDKTTNTMMEYLNRADIPDVHPSSLYFQSFLKLRTKHLRLFFIVDNFSGRVHTPITSMKGEHRRHLMIDGCGTNSIDVVTMQPVLLGHILQNQIGDNEFSDWIYNGTDIYTLLQEKAGLRNRDDAKENFFRIIFNRPDNSLVKLFGSSHWIKWINDYKSQIEIRNPHTTEKPHSNLAWLLQATEVKMMRKVWEGLIEQNIPFVSVHDEVIVPEFQTSSTEAVFNRTICNELQGVKIKIKQR
jgi:hypothetical protein